MVRISGFHPLNRGSIPRGATKEFQSTRKGVFDLVLLMKEWFSKIFVGLKHCRIKLIINAN